MPIEPDEPNEPTSSDEPGDQAGVSAHNLRRADAVDKHVGQRLRALRLTAGMSQEKLGEHLGLTFQQVQKYEKGINRMGASRLYEIAGIFGVPIAALFDGLDPPGGGMAPLAAADEPRVGLELLDACSHLRASHRRALLVVARAMLPQVLPHAQAGLHRAGSRAHDQE